MDKEMNKELSHVGDWNFSVQFNSVGLWIAVPCHVVAYCDE
jgi:hypothetical protein